MAGRPRGGAAAILARGATLRRALVASLWLVLLAPGAATAEVEALWAALRQGDAVAIMRHATAPGTGDPADFRLEECTTQRNLSEAGRAQARAIGAQFRAHGIARAEVYSSQWCRSLETARLLELGPVEPLPALNSFFSQRDQGPPQTAEIKQFLATRQSDEPLVLVTHQVNITALTEVFPRSGEVVVILPGTDAEVRVLGRIPPPA